MLQPERVLQRRQCKRGGAVISQVLVKWTGQQSNLATWENEEALRQQFLTAAAWGQAESEGGGCHVPCCCYINSYRWLNGETAHAVEEAQRHVSSPRLGGVMRNT